MRAFALLLFGAALLALALGERAVRRLPLITPALVYLGLGAAAGAFLTPPSGLDAHWPQLLVAIELALLVSLFAVGLRLRLVPRLSAWRVALLLAGPAMLVAVALGSVAAVVLLGLSWPAALLLAAIVAPTDPVLASEVQIRHDNDRDAVRLSLTAEGGLNDGSVLPLAALGLALLGAGPEDGEASTLRWWLLEGLWPLVGGAALGAGLGWGLGWLLRARARHGDPLERDELIYIGGVMLAWGLATATRTSSFLAVFALAAMLLAPLRADEPQRGSEGALAERLHGFGASIERLVEAGVVMAVGAALPGRAIDAGTVAFALVLVFAVRPLSVLAVVWPRTMAPSQRRLVAWFGIRGVGSLYYLAFAATHALPPGLAARLTDATLVAIATSIVLHGLSVTALMESYQRRRH